MPKSIDTLFLARTYTDSLIAGRAWIMGHFTFKQIDNDNELFATRAGIISNIP